MKPKTRKLKCYFCGGALRSDNAWFEIHDQETAPFHSEHIRFNQHGGKELYGALAYPGNGESLVEAGKWRNYSHVVLFAHTECGPDIGYNFSFDRLDENWDKHLREKAGWWPGISEALRERRDSNPRPCLLSGKYSLLNLAGADATPEPDATVSSSGSPRSSLRTTSARML